MKMMRADRAWHMAAGMAVGVAAAWNFSNVASVPSLMSRTYEVPVPAVGLLTALFVLVHTTLQLPAGTAIDRYGPRAVGEAALVVLALCNALAMIEPNLTLGLAARAIMGIGSGLAFVAGSAYVRGNGDSALTQGWYGGVAVGGGGLALAVVPRFVPIADWRAPYLSALVVALAGLGLLASRWQSIGSRAVPLQSTAVRWQHFAQVGKDVLIRKLSVIHGVSAGLSVVLANWTVALLTINVGIGAATAGAVASLTLLGNIVGRPIGGWVFDKHPKAARSWIEASMLGGAAGAFVLATSSNALPAAGGAALVGVAAGIPFGMAFFMAARIRQHEPGISIAFVNMWANVAIVIGVPLLGLAFTERSFGRIGFGVAACLWALGALATPSESQIQSARSIGTDLEEVRI